MPFRSSGPSKTGGVGWLTRKWTTAPSTSIGTSQWLFDESGKIASSSALYQSCAAGVVGSSAAGRRHVLPEEMLEGPHVVGQDRVLRVDDHPELALEHAEAQRVVAVGVVAGRRVGDAVVVEVEPARDAGVRRCDERVWLVDRRGPVVRDLEVVVPEGIHERAVRMRRRGRVEVELVDEQDLGPDALDDLCDGIGLGVARSRQVGQGLAGGAPVERRIECRERVTGDAADAPIGAATSVAMIAADLSSAIRRRTRQRPGQ